MHNKTKWRWLFYFTVATYEVSVWKIKNDSLVSREGLENIFRRSIEQLFKGHRDMCEFLNKATVYEIMFYRPNFTWHLSDWSENSIDVFRCDIIYRYIYIFFLKWYKNDISPRGLKILVFTRLLLIKQNSHWN